MKTPVVNGRPYYRSTGTQSTSLVRVLQKLIYQCQLHGYSLLWGEKQTTVKNFERLRQVVSGVVVTYVLGRLHMCHYRPKSRVP